MASLAATAAVAPATHADVLYVDDSARGANTGANWHDTFTDPQDALANARPGDEIRVGQGLYTPAPPNGSREATFNLVDGALLRGGYAGAGAVDPYLNDPDVFVTTLSGDLNGDDGPPQFVNSGDNSYHVLTADGVGPATRLLGLTVTAGHAVDTDPPHDRGGGLTCVNNGQHYAQRLQISAEPHGSGRRRYPRAASSASDRRVRVHWQLGADVEQFIAGGRCRVRRTDGY